jgi:hypothetical protein
MKNEIDAAQATIKLLRNIFKHVLLRSTGNYVKPP